MDRRDRPRWRMRSAGRNPSPRSASVVGQAQIVDPDAARRSSSAPSACVAWTTVVRSPRQPALASSSIGRQPCSARHSSISLRLLVRVDVERERVLGRHSGRSPRASRAGTRGRSGGRARREMPRARSSSTSARYADTTPGGSERGRRGRTRRAAARGRLPPRRPPRLRRTPRRARGSGTRRPPCSRPTASRGRPARTRRARAPASGAPPRRAWSPATPRSRHPPPVPEAHAGTCGCER